ncbi:MAG: hypothetical protein JNJ77_10525 [Planctomycetia bacterium]|nr:hypothetical protein [Planctomycetia bacterium]
MNHPLTAPGGWKLDTVIYDDQTAGIAVSLMTDNNLHQKIAVRWLPTVYRREDGAQFTKPRWMDDETGWFVLPDDFGTAVDECLLEKKVAGLEAFDPVGFEKMGKWLLENNAIFGWLCYCITSDEIAKAAW